MFLCSAVFSVSRTFPTFAKDLQHAEERNRHVTLGGQPHGRYVHQVTALGIFYQGFPLWRNFSPNFEGVHQSTGIPRESSFKTVSFLRTFYLGVF